MPGLVGVINTRGEKVSLDLMQAMRNAIRHRDWYKMDDYVNPRGTVAISRVHLGIIDKVQQPYLARNGRVKVFLHGQIYNEEVAHTDPLEFVYRLYEKQGSDFVSSLNGSFVVAIVDEDEQAVIIANDRLATRPLFYFSDGRAVYFGPEMKSLFRVASLERELNLAAVADFLANGCFTVEHTLIQGLKRMQNATVLTVSANGVAERQYWKHDFVYDEDLGLEHYRGTLANLVRQAVRRYLRYDNTYGILLSGGYDSRGILGCYLEERGGQEVRTISWGREENIPNSDCVVARRLAQKLDTEHRFYKRPVEEVIESFRECVWLGEGLTDEAASYRVFDRIRQQQGVEILLRGDELFGHRSTLVFDEPSMFRSLGLATLRNVEMYRKVLKPTYYRAFCERDAETRHYLSSKCDATNLRDRADFYCVDPQMTNVLNPFNYIKTFTMESLTPFLDYDLLDFAGTLPVKYRLDKTLYRKTILNMFPELFEEFAQVGNDIDWAVAFQTSQLQRFVYKELIEGRNVFDEFIDRDGLRSELEALFFAASGSVEQRRLEATLKAGAVRLLTKSPTVYDLTFRTVRSVQARMGKSRDHLPPGRLIMRLLILKVWGDVFLI